MRVIKDSICPSDILHEDGLFDEDRTPATTLNMAKRFTISSNDVDPKSNTIPTRAQVWPSTACATWSAFRVMELNFSMVNIPSGITILTGCGGGIGVCRTDVGSWVICWTSRDCDWDG